MFGLSISYKGKMNDNKVLIEDNIYYSNIDTESQLDIKYLLFILIKGLWVILGCAVVTTIIAAVYSFYIAKPQYDSTAMLYIYKNDKNSALFLYELNAGSQLVNDSLLLIKTPKVTQKAIDKLGLNGKMSPYVLAGRINATTTKETRILRLTVTDGDGYMAANYANAIAEAFIEEFKNIIGNSDLLIKMDYATIVERAVPSTVPARPNKTLNIILGLLVGLAIGAAIILSKEFLDNTIKSPDSIHSKLKMDILGVIPVFESK